MPVNSIPKLTINGHFAPIVDSGDKPDILAPFVYLDIIDPSSLRTKPTALRKGLLALIDTGADICRIDAQIALELGLPQKAAVSSIGGGSNIEGNLTDLSFSIFGNTSPYYYSTPAITASFRENKHPFDFILGMEFVRNFSLNINHKRNVILLQLF